MLERVISGGQTGADQAALKTARAFGIPTGGWAPRGWLTETGSAPWLATEYGLRECQTPAGERKGVPLADWTARFYLERNRLNAEMSDTVLWFGETGCLGYSATVRASSRAGCLLFMGESLSEWVLSRLRETKVLWVAGNRASLNPILGAAVEAKLGMLFTELGFTRKEPFKS